MFCLRQGQRGWGRRVARIRAVVWGGFADLVEGGAAEVAGVACEGGQVGPEILVAADGLAGAVGTGLLRAALAPALAERPAGATGLLRSGGYSSAKVRGAQVWRRCQVKQAASMQISMCPRTRS